MEKNRKCNYTLMSITIVFCLYALLVFSCGKQSTQKQGSLEKEKNSLLVPRDDPELRKYQAQIYSKIKKNWIEPKMSDKKAQYLVALVRVLIDKNGNVISREFVKKSNMGLFDKAAIIAIDGASPFPLPPERLEWEAFNEGFLIEFNSPGKKSF